MEKVDKYPKTPHLIWSKEVSRDDKRLTSVDHFIGKPLVISEKLDGSNICLTNQNVFARSHSGEPKHPSFDYLKSIHSSLKYNIDKGIIIFGEWCYAVHSIEYKELPHYLHIFGVLEGNIWKSWDDVEKIAGILNVPTVPVLNRICVKSEKELEMLTTPSNMVSTYGGPLEGYVVRLADAYEDFSMSIAKWVRKGHVQTNDHWSTQNIRKQKLKIIY